MTKHIKYNIEIITNIGSVRFFVTYNKSSIDIKTNSI